MIGVSCVPRLVPDRRGPRLHLFVTVLAKERNDSQIMLATPGVLRLKQRCSRKDSGSVGQDGGRFARHRNGGVTMVALTEQVEARVRQATHDRIRGLSVEGVRGRVVIRGTSATYH